MTVHKRCERIHYFELLQIVLLRILLFITYSIITNIIITNSIITKIIFTISIITNSNNYNRPIRLLRIFINWGPSRTDVH